MKLPRWLVVSLLTVSALAVLGAGAWWWITWPESTAREFHELMRDGRRGQAVRMMDTPIPNESYQSIVAVEKPRPCSLDMTSRGLADMVAGRVQFQLTFSEGDGDLEYYVVRRGKVYRLGSIAL